MAAGIEGSIEMFNLLVKSSPWAASRDMFWQSRVFEYTEPSIAASFQVNGVPDYQELKKLPALFVEETSRSNAQWAHVGRIVDVRRHGTDDIAVEYFFDPAIPPISQAEMVRLAPMLGVPANRYGPASFSRTHWAVKDVDLYHLLFTQFREEQRRPQVFSIPYPRVLERDLLSAMMPFAGFGATWEAIQRAATLNGMRSARADNIWEHHEIIQDIVSLIDKCAIVVCDCTSRNANVFYEIGIAHSLGKEVILITQSAQDIPFDLAHLRNIRYLNNGEGIAELERELSARIATLQARH